jgi:hypothetical protein
MCPGIVQIRYRPINVGLTKGGIRSVQSTLGMVELAEK